jgi:predicted O-methyltransferase YrrM
MNKNYHFTESWFSHNDLDRFVPKTTDEIKMLEVGSFEGRSTVWFLENVLLNSKSTITCVDPWTTYSQNSDTFNSYFTSESEWDFRNHKRTFLHNIYNSGFMEKVTVIQDSSHLALPKLISNGDKFDIIFIDGNHTSPFVITDCVMSWYLLNKGGLMIFDDYLWGDVNSTNSPKIAIDSFVNCFKDYLEVVWSDYKFAIKRIK